VSQSSRFGQRAATDVDLATCADEPIHIPGAIQPHGALLVAVGDDPVITHASANLASIIGIEATTAIGQGLVAVLGADTVARLHEALAAEHYTLAYLTDQPVMARPTRRCNLTAHRSGAHCIVEIEPAQPDRANALSQAQSILTSLWRQQSLPALCDHVVRELRALTGYDRVMVYRFDPDGHGSVIAEALVAELEPYLGLHYPASDIPEQARRLYLAQRIRVIPAVGLQQVPILADPALTDPALDMSQCTLRATSPIHLEYLANMGVGATLALSIVHDRALWGMVVCHHRTPRLPSQFERTLCDLIGQLLGLVIGEIEERGRLAARLERQRVLAALTDQLDYRPSLVETLSGQSQTVLQLTAATGVFIRLGGHTMALGATPPPPICDAIVQTLRNVADEDVLAIDDLGIRHADYWRVRDCASGVLVLPIGTAADDVLVWFRPQVSQTVVWAGDPRGKATVELASGRISPRRSFAAWREIVAGRSLPWAKADIDAAMALRRALTRALLRHTEAELFRISNTDPLTGLANRSVLNQHLAEWRASELSPPAALLFLDLDRFKTVNDSLGHFAGDDLLHAIGARLGDLAGERCLAVRLGGDEFALFQTRASRTEAEDLANRLLDLFAAPFDVAGRPYLATASIGIAYAATRQDDLLRDADTAMYAAKRAGGNRAVMFDPAQHDTVRNRLRIEQDLFLALDQHQLVVHYQPVVRLHDNATYAYEALLRWHHAELGWVSPLEFITLAEETGQIERIGRWVAEEAIGQLARLGDPALLMTINVSAQQLRLGGVRAHVSDALARHGIAADRIMIEVTESTLMDPQAVHALGQFRTLGCGIAIDDFGTGYSSLAYLRRLPVTTIKIDRSFVTPLDIDRKSQQFMGALIILAHTLDIRVIAEGVETLAQRTILTDLGCDAAQGYLFGRAEPLA
jgi:diguanylate cyclase (GGDEF)-like protein